MRCCIWNGLKFPNMGCGLCYLGYEMYEMWMWDMKCMECGMYRIYFRISIDIRIPNKDIMLCFKRFILTNKGSILEVYFHLDQ